MKLTKKELQKLKNDVLYFTRFLGVDDDEIVKMFLFNDLNLLVGKLTKKELDEIAFHKYFKRDEAVFDRELNRETFSYLVYLGKKKTAEVIAHENLKDVTKNFEKVVKKVVEIYEDAEFKKQIAKTLNAK